MPDLAVPSSGDAGVCTAVALGWQVAELFHSPLQHGPVTDPVRGERLPGRSAFSAATQSKWLGEQIQTHVTALLPAGPQPLSDALAATVNAVTNPGRDPETTLDGVFTLHCRLLEALSVANFRLGKAYGLGRALAETALVPAAASDQDSGRQFRALLGEGRLGTIEGWLCVLKTLLPDHTAHAVIHGLRAWGTWATGPRSPADWNGARGPIRIQGRIWRELLTGEKAAKDILTMSDYLVAARHVARRVITSLRHFWWLTLLILLVGAGLVLAVSSFKNVPPTVRLIVNVVWVAGVLGASLKGAGALLGIALRDGEGWLWQAELDESVAAAATRLPAAATPPPAATARLAAVVTHRTATG